MGKRKRFSPEEWAAIEAESEAVAQRLEARIAKIKAELEEKRRLAAERPVRRRRLFGLR
jgi:hypothetical protein